MVAQCVSAIQARTMRLVKLDTCGNPVSGAGSAVVVTDGFISIDPSPQYLDGQEHQQRKASGALCLYKKDPSELTRVDLTIKLCVMDPDAIVVMTGERLLTAGGVTGSGVAFGEGQLTARYSLETWQPVVGPLECDPVTGAQRFIYWAFMNVGNSKVDNWSLMNGPLEFAIKSETQHAGTGWADGPGSAGPWFSGTAATDEHFLYNVTTTAPPTPTCGAVLLT